MRTATQLVLSACFLAIPATATAQGEKKPTNILEEMKRREREIKASEDRKEWQKISWRTTPAGAVADATKESKPLLVVLIVGELGRSNADRC